MKIQSISNETNFKGNVKLKNTNVQQLQKYLKRASLAVGADVLILNGSSMQGEVAPPAGFEKVDLPWYQRVWNTIIGQPTYKYVSINEPAQATVNATYDSISNEVNKLCYDKNIIDRILKGLHENGEINIDKNSIDAVHFVLFQHSLLENGIITEPLVDINEVIDLDQLEILSDTLLNGFDYDNINNFLEVILGNF